MMLGLERFGWRSERPLPGGPSRPREAQGATRRDPCKGEGRAGSGSGVRGYSASKRKREVRRNMGRRPRPGRGRQAAGLGKEPRQLEEPTAPEGSKGPELKQIPGRLEESRLRTSVLCAVIGRACMRLRLLGGSSC